MERGGDLSIRTAIKGIAALLPLRPKINVKDRRRDFGELVYRAHGVNLVAVVGDLYRSTPKGRDGPGHGNQKVQL